jgi:SAM-dependent methyltransferase
MEELEPVPTTKHAKRKAAQEALDMTVKNEVGRILGERKLKRRGRESMSASRAGRMWWASSRAGCPGSAISSRRFVGETCWLDKPMADEVCLHDFRRYYPYAPTALAIRQCSRLAALRGVALPGPILDVGCGDGVFGRLAYSGGAAWGIEINPREAELARASGAYARVMTGDVTDISLPEGSFGSCVANCSLEHVPDLDRASRNILGGLRPGGTLYAFVPNRDWASYLVSASALRRLGLRRGARTIERALNQVFRHWHLDDEAGWRRRFEVAGFVVDSVRPVGTTASTRAFEAFLLPALIGLLNKRLTGRWTVSSHWRARAAPAAYLCVRAVLAVGHDCRPTAEYLVCARRPSRRR